MEIEPNEGWRVGKGELRIRFGCGAFAGLLVGGLIVFQRTTGNLWITIPAAVISAGVIGVIATKYGDRFWWWVMETLWWQWPTPK